MGLKKLTILVGEKVPMPKPKPTMEYIEGPPRNGKPAWKDIWITMTINSANYSTAVNLADEWVGKVNKIGFQFHTPFMKGIHSG
jgi:hypothetical protein